MNRKLFLLSMLMVILVFCSGCGLLNYQNSTETKTYFTKPSWTPDNKIIYLYVEQIDVTDFDGILVSTTWEVTLKKMAINGTEEPSSDFVIVSQITPEGFSPPSYSPDGNKWGIIIGNKLRVYDAENTLLDSYDLSITYEAEESHPWNKESHFSWNSDGSQIVYSVGINESLRTFALSTEADVELSTEGRFPSWSSDGLSIVYCSVGKVYKLDLSTGETTLLISGMSSIHPDIYEDSKIICRRANSLIRYDISEGTEEEFSITGIWGNIKNPLWSPEGNYITFYSESVYYEVGIYVINDDGSDLSLLKSCTNEAS